MQWQETIIARQRKLGWVPLAEAAQACERSTRTLMRAIKARRIAFRVEAGMHFLRVADAQALYAAHEVTP